MRVRALPAVLVLVAALAGCTSGAAPDPTASPEPDALAGWTLEEKIGQLVMVGVDLAAMQAGIDSLGYPGVKLVAEEVHRKGFRGLKVHVQHEPEKARIARRHFAEANLSSLIDLREGDLRHTLRDVLGPIDFMLIDIWTPMARPALELIAPHLRDGAVVVADNTQQFREAYRDYFEFVHDPRNGLRTMTLPFEGGLEFTVRDGNY